MITGTPFNEDTHSMQIRGPHVADAHAATRDRRQSTRLCRRTSGGRPMITGMHLRRDIDPPGRAPTSRMPLLQLSIQEIDHLVIAKIHGSDQ